VLPSELRLIGTAAYPRRGEAALELQPGRRNLDEWRAEEWQGDYFLGLVRLVRQGDFFTLAAPFAPSEVKWKPIATNDNRAMALAFVDARTVMDRLDAVLGVDGWQDEYEILPGGSAICRLKVWAGSGWITKMDAGSPSEQPDQGDQTKAALSDAHKRAAVKVGVGRYLPRLPRQWCDFDAKARRFTRPPQLPAWALPGQKSAA
jgi:hypothetical protein